MGARTPGQHHWWVRAACIVKALTSIIPSWLVAPPRPSPPRLPAPRCTRGGLGPYPPRRSAPLTREGPTASCGSRTRLGGTHWERRPDDGRAPRPNQPGAGLHACGPRRARGWGARTTSTGSDTSRPWGSAGSTLQTVSLVSVQQNVSPHLDLLEAEAAHIHTARPEDVSASTVGLLELTGVDGCNGRGPRRARGRA
jgi:hypothetical protein